MSLLSFLILRRVPLVSRVTRLVSLFALSALAALLASCGGSSTTTTTTPPPPAVTSTCNFSLRGLSQECTFSYTDSKGQRTRTMMLHIPVNFVAAQGLVIYLHGAGGTDAEGEGTGWSQKSESIGFVAVYPQAEPVGPQGGNTWADYFSPGLNNPPDDVTFLSTLITYFEATPLSLNAQHIYVTGFSSGGYMAHRLAVELSPQIAAIASVSGALMEAAAQSTTQVGSAKGPVSVLLLNGDQDSSVLYCGQNDSAGLSSSVDATFAYWTSAKANSCATLTPTAGSNPNAFCDGNGVQTSITTRRGSSCLQTTEVVAYQLHQGTHQYYGLSTPTFGFPQGIPLGTPIPLNISPGTSFLPYNPNFTVGTGVNTVDICWTFFQGHAKHAN